MPQPPWPPAGPPLPVPDGFPSDDPVVAYLLARIELAEQLVWAVLANTYPGAFRGAPPAPGPAASPRDRAAARGWQHFGPPDAS